MILRALGWKLVRKFASLAVTVSSCFVIFILYPHLSEVNQQNQQDALAENAGYTGIDPSPGAVDTGTVVDPCSRPNVLLLISDDLRPQLGSYRGQDHPDPVSGQQAFTPHLDKLADKSLVLGRAYAQWSSCGPSRSSFLTGRRPRTTKVWDLHTSWRQSGGNFTSLPQLFKDNGYLTAGAGKIFHPLESDTNDPISWTVPFYEPPNLPAWSRVSTVGVSWKAVSKAERKATPLEDEQTTDYALNLLKSLAPKANSCEQPFFLAVGFHKPHLPFVFPEEFLKFYPISEVNLPTNPYAPVNMPETAWDDYIELRRYLDIHKLHNKGTINETIPEHTSRLLRRAYYASVSYVDALIGNILKEVHRLGLDNSTIVTFVSDHGFSLGENGEWGKHTNFEQSLRVPAMLHVPGRTDMGIKSRSLAELVDLYPTLAEAAGLLPVEACPALSVNTSVCTEGASWIPLIDDPTSSIKDAAFSQHKRNNLRMGYSIRSDRFRYTEWVQISRTWSSYERWDFHNNWQTPLGVELYDHHQDPLETINIADEQLYQDIRRILSYKLREHFTDTVFDFPRNSKSLFLDY